MVAWLLVCGSEAERGKNLIVGREKGVRCRTKEKKKWKKKIYIYIYIYRYPSDRVKWIPVEASEAGGNRVFLKGYFNGSARGGAKPDPYRPIAIPDRIVVGNTN